MKNRERASAWAIAIAILVTISLPTALTLDALTVGTYFAPGYLVDVAIMWLAFVILYPILGALWVLICLGLNWLMRRLYDLDTSGPGRVWGKWSPNARIIVASLWPIVCPPFVILTTVGVIYGALFKLIR